MDYQREQNIEKILQHLDQVGLALGAVANDLVTNNEWYQLKHLAQAVEDITYIRNNYKDLLNATKALK